MKPLPEKLWLHRTKVIASMLYSLAWTELGAIVVVGGAILLLCRLLMRLEGIDPWLGK